MTFVLGVDGCHNGWVVAICDLATGDISWRLHHSAAEFLRPSPDVAAIAIDIPIGLPDSGPRACDQQARHDLGPKRSSVFPAPVRSILAAYSYAEACRLGQAADGRKISRQTYNVLPKIREVDGLLRQFPELVMHVHEVHPELSFASLAGGKPLQYSKKSSHGQAERNALLAAAFGKSWDPLRDAWLRAEMRVALSGLGPITEVVRCQPDDVLDAFAALWTAGRIAAGQRRVLPSDPPCDGCGLPMKISV